MSTKVFKKWDIKDAVYGDIDENSPLILIEREYENQCILQDRSTELYYRYILNETGTGAEYSFEWEKEDIELTEVVKVSKVIKAWVAVELGNLNIK